MVPATRYLPNATQGDLFSYKLDYETAGFYDGNIGKQSWQSVENNSPLGLRAYTYTYDPVSRLKSATYEGINGEDYSLPNLSYDKNGNITNLQRKGKNGSSYGDIDNLSYTYSGNRLNQVTDAIVGNHDVDLIPRRSGNYTYYTDGSLKSDENEQIASIIYDTYLKQSQEINLTDGRWIKYYYDGGGALLKTSYSTNELWEYTDKIIYKNGIRYQISQQEGRLIYENNDWKFEFQYADHLGNTRVAFRANGTQLEKMSDTSFDPWGVVLNGVNQLNGFQNRFEFQGKEKESTFNLNRVNLGARTYNATIGRFDRIDPLAEKFTSYSPYVFSLNNPLRFIDPNGAAPFDITLLGANNSSVTVKTDLVDLKINASGLGVDFGGNYILSGNDILQAAVDIGGVFDPTPTLDIVGASLSAESGDYWGAGASVLGAALPYVGDLAKTGKIAKGVEKISEAVSLSKAEARAAKLSKAERPGLDFTKAGKEATKDVNKAKNAGEMKCESCNTNVENATQHKKGQTPPSNEAHVDHHVAKSKGGSGTPANGKVLCRDCNLKKGAN